MTYHVARNPETNKIYAGTISKKEDKWTNKTEVTEECLLAVRDHFLWIADKEQTDDVGFRWEFNDGTEIFLKVIIQKKEEKTNEES